MEYILSLLLPVFLPLGTCPLLSSLYGSLYKPTTATHLPRPPACQSQHLLSPPLSPLATLKRPSVPQKNSPQPSHPCMILHTNTATHPPPSDGSEGCCQRASPMQPPATLTDVNSLLPRGGGAWGGPSSNGSKQQQVRHRVRG